MPRLEVVDGNDVDDSVDVAVTEALELVAEVEGKEEKRGKKLRGATSAYYCDTCGADMALNADRSIIGSKTCGNLIIDQTVD